MRWLLFVACCLFALPAQAAEKWNIVFIISDDHGAEDYSFLGHPTVQTPNLDRLAKESLVYRNGYSVTSLCCPSLATILTGRYPHETGVANNDPPKPANKKGKELLADEKYQKLRQGMIEKIQKVETLPRLLQKQGYMSFQTGKWWQGSYTTGGFTHGMSHGDPLRSGRHGDAGLTIGRNTMQPIADFLDEAKKADKPFFLWYAPMLPHTPHNAPPKFQNKYKGKHPSEFVTKYWANIDWFDETCGDLLKMLDDRQLKQNTLVVYITDNGWLQDPKANAPARSKLTQYDAGHRTPIMLRLPGKIEPRMSLELASSIDLVPTVCQLLGVEPPANLPGLSLLNEKAVQERKAIFGEDFNHDAVDIDKPEKSLRFRWIREGGWRLIVPNPAVEPKAEIELYALRDDPGETLNRATTDPNRVELMKKKLDAWWKP